MIQPPFLLLWNKVPEHPLALLASSPKKFWATPTIASSGSMSRVAISLTCPFTFTMSLRMRWVITSPAVCLTLGQGSRNLTGANSYCRKQQGTVSELLVLMTTQSSGLPAPAYSTLLSWFILTLSGGPSTGDTSKCYPSTRFSSRPLPTMSVILPGIEMWCPRLHQVGEADG